MSLGNGEEVAAGGARVAAWAAVGTLVEPVAGMDGRVGLGVTPLQADKTSIMTIKKGKPNLVRTT